MGMLGLDAKPSSPNFLANPVCFFAHLNATVTFGVDAVYEFRLRGVPIDD
jgi:hypothetical protein